MHISVDSPLLQETGEILAILQSYHWSPMSLTYDNVSCNLDHNNNTIYLLATPVGSHHCVETYCMVWVKIAVKLRLIV